MKKPFLLFFLLLSFAISAQIGLKLSNFRPTGDLGASVKPAIGAELSYVLTDKDEDVKLRPHVSLSFAKFTPRKDTFPTYGVIEAGGTTVTPGYTVIHKYSITCIGLGADYIIKLNDKLHLYPGADVGILFTSIAYDSYAPLISSEGYSGGYVFLNFKLRLGAEYTLTEKLQLFAEANRSMNFSPQIGGLAYNDYGIGLRFYF